MTAYRWFVGYLAASGSRRAGKHWQCPAHEDASPSLSVAEGNDGMVLVHCFAGCTTQKVLWSLGLGVGLLFEPHPYPPEAVLARQAKPPIYPLMKARGGSGTRRSRGQPVEVLHHIYLPDLIRLERRRYADGRKDCTWERKIGAGWEYAQGLAMDTLPLYQHDQVVMAVASGEPVVVCESESSVDALMKAGIYATTWAGGASAPQIPTLRGSLTRGRAILIPDNDPAGLACRDRIVPALNDICDLSILLPPPGKDARDLLHMWGSTRLRQAIADLPAGQSQQVLVTR